MLEARTLKTSPIGTVCYPALGEDDFLLGHRDRESTMPTTCVGQGG